MKKDTKSHAPTEAELCIDCDWLKTQVDFDSGSNYRCSKHRLKERFAGLSRPACAQFEPQSED